MISVVIPSCTDAYVESCLSSLQPKLLDNVVVADSGLSKETRHRWWCKGVQFVEVPRPFVYARAVNMGVRWAQSMMGRGKDHLLILNDDTRLRTPDGLDRLDEFMARHHDVGLAGALIEGEVGNEEQSADRWLRAKSKDLKDTGRTLCFVAVVIRADVWRCVGELDERFVGYGYDDDDYCRRARDAGWRTVVTDAARFSHGEAGYALSSTYRRVHKMDKLNELYLKNKQLYVEKWGGMP